MTPEETEVLAAVCRIMLSFQKTLAKHEELLNSLIEKTKFLDFKSGEGPVQ